MRSISARLGEDAGSAARRDLGDSDDYSATTVDTEGDSATLQRQGAKPMPLIRINDKWCFSMPDWFALQTRDTLAATRAYYESSADQLDAAREQIEAGKLKSLEEIEELLQKIAATR